MKSVTMKDVAQLAGVSRPLVSAVLHNRDCSIKMSQEVRERVLNVLKETGYVPNLAAQQLNGVSDHLIGVITVPSHLGLIASLQCEVISVLQQNGFEVLTAQMDAALDPQKTIRMFQARKVCGVIALNLMQELNLQKLCPMVYCSHDNLCGFDVGYDLETGSYEAATHLVNVHGVRKPVFLSMEPQPGILNLRKIKGIQRALQDHGLQFSNTNILCGNFSVEQIQEELTARRADAVCCGNDFIAARLLQRLDPHKIRVPEDMAVIGYDGYSFCNFTSVPLATILQPLRRQAEAAVELLKKRIEHHDGGTPFQNQKLIPEFRPNRSCGCPENSRDERIGQSNLLFLSP